MKRKLVDKQIIQLGEIKVLIFEYSDNLTHIEIVGLKTQQSKDSVFKCIADFINNG